MIWFACVKIPGTHAFIVIIILKKQNKTKQPELCIECVAVQWRIANYLCIHFHIIEYIIVGAAACVRTNFLIYIHTQFNWILYYVY